MVVTDKKLSEAYRSIGEVSAILEVEPHVLRFWETRFFQLKPLKRAGGRRLYSLEDLELLKFIRDLLYKEGLTIKGVQRNLREKGVKKARDEGKIKMEGTARLRLLKIREDMLNLINNLKNNEDKNN